MNIALWVIQALLAALFLMAGIMKLIMPMDQMKGPVELPELFVRFLGVVETLGGLGLLLPGIFKIKTGLTPLAAAGLVIIMIGATVISLKVGVSAAIMPLVTGLLAAFVAYGRWKLVPLRER
jgi:uncharacterized membrane protein YphA (DoxX/SURF4 family)